MPHCANVFFGLLNELSRRVCLDFSCGVVGHQAQTLGATQGARQFSINLSGKNRVLSKCLADSTMRPRELPFGDTRLEEGSPRDVEHRVVSAVYRAVGVFILQTESRNLYRPFALPNKRYGEGMIRHS